MSFDYLLVFTSLLLSAFFSGMELAYLASNRLKIEVQIKQNTFQGKILSVLYKKDTTLLAMLLLGNNIALVVYGISAASILNPVILDWGITNNASVLILQTLLSTLLVLVTAEFLPKAIVHINPNNFLNVGIVVFSSSLLNKLFHDTGSSTFHFILEVLSITFMILMIGEVIPKVYATKNGLLFAKLMAFPLRSLSSIPPFSWLKSFLVNGTKIIHKYAKYRGVSITTDELEQAILLTKEESTSEEEQKILEGIIKFGNTDVKQIMRSRMEVVYLEEDFDFQIVFFWGEDCFILMD
jgi:CBS domain containing-hemolysin-like protein